MSFADTRALARKAGRDVIWMDGVDITHFRGYTTPFPRYLLTEPFAYGATSIQLPQVHAGFERLGVGELSFAREGADVTIGRVYDDGTVKIDYRGEVVSVQASGRVPNIDIGGQFSGPAGDLQEQNQLYRQSLDVGRYASLAAARCGLSFSPWFGPATGIKITHTGGQSLQSWAQFVGAMSQDANGLQRALMPTVWGSNTWGFNGKDYTTRHFTALNDDARVVLDVTRDSTEAPTTIYGTGITPDGELIRNGKWPNLFAGPAPDYPKADNSAFGLGTTDADTVNGDGITVLYDKLRTNGFLAWELENTGVYTSAFVAGVRKLQKDVDLTVTGTMTLATWKRLYNVDRVGTNINGAHIAPLASDPRVEEFLYTSNGSIAGRNPVYDASVRRVEVTIDFGSGMTKAAMIGYAQGILARAAAMKNWVGTLRLAGSGVFTGSHDSGAGLTEADLMPYRDIRPGMNVWVPYFDGGTLFHVAGVDVDDSGATLTIDTQARDLVEVAQIKARNRESRRDIRREFFAANRPAKPSTAMIACDEDFGKLDRNHKLIGGQWNKISVLAGQHGQVNRVRIQTVNDKAEFAVMVTSRDYGEKWVAHNVGNPMVTGAESVWQKESLADEFEERRILYALGDAKDPGGYSNRSKYNTDGDLTHATLTGILIDDNPWPYINAAHTAAIVYLWIWPDRDCTLKRGRVMFPQLDDAAA